MQQYVHTRWHYELEYCKIDELWEIGDTDCWYECGEASGKCSVCGNNGYCCSGYKTNDNAGCTNTMVNAIRQKTTRDLHVCIAPGGSVITTRKPTTTKRTTTTTTKPTTTEISITDCVDLGEHCEYWARTGECNKNPSYMNVKCKRSCKLCDGQSS